MKFTPISDEQVAEEKAKFGPWPRGAYDFEIASAVDKTSKAGNEMIELDMMVYDQHGHRRNIKDWLVDSVPVKLRHACEAVGLHAAYANGNIASHDFVGRTGKLMLGIERREGYDDRNKVTGYVPAIDGAPVKPSSSRPPAAAARQKAPAGDIDDEVPF